MMKLLVVVVATLGGSCAGDDVETTASMTQRGASALKRVPAIAREVAKQRGLELKTEVPVAYQDEAGHRKVLRSELADDLPPELSERITTAMLHIGLLPGRIDLSKVIEDDHSGARAYYTTIQKRIFLRQVLDERAVGARLAFDATIAHELTHALQDQYFDMSAYLDPALDSDASSARFFVVEGDAMVVAEAYRYGESMPPSPRLVDLFERLAAMDPLSRLHDTANPDRPLLVVGPHIEVYNKGPIVILRAYQRGGWNEVARLYTDPPESTAQVLHPDTKLYPTRQHPRRIEIPLPLGYLPVHADVVGELGWRLYFMQWQAHEPAAAADGWAGDRYRVMRGPDGALTGVIVSIWDTADDAKEFVDAYEASLAARFPSATTTGSRDAAGALSAGDHRIFLRRLGTTVVIVDRADTAARPDQVTDQLIDRVIAGLTID